MPIAGNTEVSLLIPVLTIILFIRILATAIILDGVQLLIKGSSYSRATFINFGVTPLGDSDTMDSFSGLIFLVFSIKINLIIDK